MQILLVTPTQDNYIAIPDNSGIFVVNALAPLYLDTGGNVYLQQGEITRVGQLTAGSITRSFGELPHPCFWADCHLMHYRLLICMSVCLSVWLIWWPARCLHATLNVRDNRSVAPW